MATHILLVRLSSIGDVIHTLPAAAALRRRFPEARIDWLVEKRYRELLEGNPDVDSLIEVDTLGWRKRLYHPRIWKEILAAVGRVRGPRYDVVLDFQGTIKSSVSAFLARGERRIGFHRRHLKERVAALLYSEAVSPNGSSPHVIDRNLRLLKSLGIETGERAFPIVVPRKLEDEARRNIEALALSDYVVLNPGGSWKTKRWAPEKFGRLGAAIEKEWRFPSLVVWGPGEEDMARTVVVTAGSTARLAPRTTFLEMAPYIRRARLFVSGDSGPLHLASALGVPAVGIFGPTDPARNGPFGAGDETVSRPVPCGPCYKNRCPGYGNVCMTSIEVEDVLAAVRTRLGRA